MKQTSLAIKGMDVALPRVLVQVAAVLLAALLLLWPALINGYPFIFIDTNRHLFLTYAPVFTSYFYTVFVVVSSLKTSLWATALAQSAISAHLLFLLNRIYGGTLKTYALMVLLLAVVSSLPLVVSLPIADAFTGVMVLALYLLGLHFDRFSLPTRMYLIGIAWLAIAVHLSHIPIVLGLLFVVGLAARLCNRPWRRVLEGVGLVGMCAALAIGGHVVFNKVAHGRATLSPVGQTFFLANLIEYGPARTTIQESCLAAAYKLCAYVDTLPTDAEVFLFEWPEFAMRDRFIEMREEASAIVMKTLRDRPLDVARMVLGNFLRALVTVGPEEAFAVDDRPFGSKKVMTPVLQHKFGEREGRAFLGSLQSRDRWPAATVDLVHGLIFPLVVAALLVLCLVAWRRGARHGVAFAVYAALAYAGNALVCATFSGVHGRYQARVSWLLVAAIAVMVLQAFSHRWGGMTAEQRA
jgi:hypothetical protein